jgi:methyl-accepting chemotaxis protein
MSYKVQLGLTHLASVLGGMALVWLAPGLGVSGIVVCLVGLVVLTAIPAGTAFWMLNRSLQQFEAGLAAGASANGAPHGEFATLATRFGQATQQHRDAAQEAAALIRRLNNNSAQDPAGNNRRLLTRLLGQMARAATKDAGRIAAFADDISRLAHETAAEANQQSEAVARTVTFAEQLSSNITAVSRNADAAKEAAGEVRESSARGQELVQELMRGMDRIRLSVEAGEKKVLALGERSRGIGSIVETMGSISARAQMLALNASIEAVRAGEDGRGFSVVAEEVRRLSEHTATAAREISQLVELIQLESQDTIATMAEERAQVQQEVLRVREAGEALEQIGETSSNSADRVGEISLATADQLRGTQEVVMAMQLVLDLAEAIGQRADRMRRTTADVKAASRDLEDRMAPLYHFEEDLEQPAVGRTYERLARMNGSSASAPGAELVAAVEQGEFAR